MHSGNSPAETSVFQLVAHQFEYIDQLENENRMIRIELDQMKQRLMEVVEENQAIHDVVRSETVAKTLVESNNILDRANKIDSVAPNFIQQDITSKREFKEENVKLKAMEVELEKMQALYNAKIGTLESHAKVLEADLKLAKEESVYLKTKLNKHTDGTQIPSDISNRAAPHAPLIERLTSERTSLLKTIATQQSHVKNMQEQETTLREDIQKSLAALEEMQHQKTEIMIEKEQLRKDLNTTQAKLDQEIVDGQKKALDAALQQRQHFSRELESNQKKLGELMATCAHYENVIETMGREKARLSMQLDESRSQVLNAEKDLSKLEAEVKSEVKTAVKGYTSVEQDLRDARSKLEEQQVKLKQELSRYEQQNADLLTRLSNAESLTLKLQETNVEFSQQLNNSLAELNITKSNHQEAMQSLQTRCDNLQVKYHQEVKALQNTLEASDLEYSERLTSVEDVSSKQAKLITKLRKECKCLSGELADLTHKYREEIGTLGQKNEQLHINTHRLAVKNKELSEQCVQHGMTHRVMQDRLCRLNSRAHISSNQVLELLDKQAQLSQRKEVLNKEVRFLQSQVLPHGK